MKRSLGSVLAASALACLVSASTRTMAEVQGQTWEVEVYLGYYDPSPDVLDSDVVWGLRVGYNFSERLNLFGDLGRFDGSGKVDDVDLTYDARGFDLNAAWQLTPEKKWVTLLYGGLGWAFVDFEADTEPLPVKLGDDSFTFNFGAAGKLQLKERIYLRFDARARWYKDRDGDEIDTLGTVAIGWSFGS